MEQECIYLKTEDGPIVVSREGQLKPRDKQWCSGCAKQGHLEYECNYYNRMYPPNNPRIMSYEDVLYDNRRRPNEVVPPLASNIASSTGPPTQQTNIPSLLSLHVPVPTELKKREQVVATGAISAAVLPTKEQSFQPLSRSESLSGISKFSKNVILDKMRLNYSNEIHQQEGQGVSTKESLKVFEMPTQIVGLSEIEVNYPNNSGVQGGYVINSQNRQVTKEFGSSSKDDLVSRMQINDGTREGPVEQTNRACRNAVLNEMRLNYLREGSHQERKVIDPRSAKEHTQELCKNDKRRVKHIIMSMPCHKVREFLKREMADVKDVATQTDPKYLKKMLFKFDGLWRSKRPLKYEDLREGCFWNRILNIFIFGVHKFRDGKLHLNYLKSCLSEPKKSKLDIHKRKSLFNSYSYIFGVDRHANVGYGKIIQRIIHMYEKDGKRRVS